MQQTETYNLNLIESPDTFSPGPLNENAQKIEAAIAAETAARAAETAALDGRVTTLEAYGYLVGSYTATGAEQVIEVGFTPSFVYVEGAYLAPGRNYVGSNTILAKLVDNGFKLCSSSFLTSVNSKHWYIAFR